MNKELLIARIKEHSSFSNLDRIKQGIIVCPAYIEWLVVLHNCFKIDQEQTNEILINHKSVPKEITEIYFDILNH